MERLLLFVVVVLAAGCGGPHHSVTSLRLTATSSIVGKAVFTLRCGPVGGNVGQPGRACAAIARDPRVLLHPAPLVDPLACRQGGLSPWGITVAGRFRGRPLLIRTLVLCWSSRAPLLSALGIAGELGQHLVCSRTRHAPFSGLPRCEPTPPLSIVGHVRMRLVRTPPPFSRGPARGVADVAFLDARRGFDVTANGLIQRTRDGGDGWTTIWSRSRTSLDWIGFVGRHGFAAGVTYERCAPQTCPGRPLLLTGDDAGSHWRALRPYGATEGWAQLMFEFVSERVGFAFTDPDASSWSGQLVRTDDGGRSWTLLSTRLRGFDFLDAARGYATGSRGRSSCVFATTDGGLRWRVLPSSCRPFTLSSVYFVDARRGFAGGGLPYFAANQPFQAVLLTRDGGRSWRTIFRGSAEAHPGLPIVWLVMTDATHGLAATGGCKLGQNSPCGGAVLATDDGGRSWRDTGQSAGRVVTAGTALAWVVPSCDAGCDLVWRTADGGRTWAPLTRPADVAFSTIDAAGSWLLAAGELGTYRSRDSGRSWHPFALPAPAGTQPWQQRIARPGLDAVAGTRRLEVSRDGGATWRAATLPLSTGFGLSAIAFADAEHGLAAQEAFGCAKSGAIPRSPLFATVDGGVSWRRLPTPPFGIDALAGVAGLWVAETEGAACGRHAVAVSDDGGRTWSSHELPHLWDCSPSVAPPATIWLACGSTLLTSSDGGAMWTELTARRFEIRDAAAPAWLVGGPPGDTPTLWQTNDAGRTLRERWPTR